MVNAFVGLIAYLNVPGNKKRQNKRFREIMENRKKKNS